MSLHGVTDPAHSATRISRLICSPDQVTRLQCVCLTGYSLSVRIGRSKLQLSTLQV